MVKSWIATGLVVGLAGCSPHGGEIRLTRTPFKAVPEFVVPANCGVPVVIEDPPVPRSGYPESVRPIESKPKPASEPTKVSSASWKREVVK